MFQPPEHIARKHAIEAILQDMMAMMQGRDDSRCQKCFNHLAQAINACDTDPTRAHEWMQAWARDTRRTKESLNCFWCHPPGLPHIDNDSGLVFSTR